MLSRRRILTLATAYASGFSIISLPAAAPKAPATAPAGAKFAPAFKAMDYYDDSCRRCHGPEGSFYGSELGKGLTDTQLNDIVKRMCDGPGNSPLTPSDLAVETAFHRALVSGNPYLSVTELAADKIGGEVMPEAKVTITLAGDPAAKPIAATVDDHTWSAKLPANSRASDITVTADLHGKSTVLSLAKSPAYSNSTPLSTTTKPAK